MTDKKTLAEPEGEKRLGAAIAIGGPGTGRSPSACSRDRCGERHALRGRMAGPRSTTGSARAEEDPGSADRVLYHQSQQTPEPAKSATRHRHAERGSSDSWPLTTAFPPDWPTRLIRRAFTSSRSCHALSTGTRSAPSCDPSTEPRQWDCASDVLGHRSAVSTSTYLRLATGDLHEITELWRFKDIVRKDSFAESP